MLVNCFCAIGGCAIAIGKGDCGSNVCGCDGARECEAVAWVSCNTDINVWYLWVVSVLQVAVLSPAVRVIVTATCVAVMALGRVRQWHRWVSCHNVVSLWGQTYNMSSLNRPQYCSMKFSSQWNFGKKMTSKPWPWHKISSTDSWSVNSGWLYRTWHWQAHSCIRWTFEAFAFSLQLCFIGELSLL